MLKKFDLVGVFTWTPESMLGEGLGQTSGLWVLTLEGRGETVDAAVQSAITQLESSIPGYGKRFSVESIRGEFVQVFAQEPGKWDMRVTVKFGVEMVEMLQLRRELTKKLLDAHSDVSSAPRVTVSPREESEVTVQERVFTVGDKVRFKHSAASRLGKRAGQCAIITEHDFTPTLYKVTFEVDGSVLWAASEDLELVF